jgi:Tfp pilus assembly protein FimT
MRYRQRPKGFSLTETLAVVLILTTAATIAVMGIGSAVRNSHVQTAYENIIMQLRAARQIAVDQRVITAVTFSTPGTIRTDMIKGGATTNVTQLSFPSDVAFTAISGIPNTTATTPDGFGIGNNAIDFDQGFSATPGAVVYFYPDGSAQDTKGNFNNGVAYIAHPGDLKSSRAVSLFGATGRVRGWTLVKNSSGVYLWQ